MVVRTGRFAHRAKRLADSCASTDRNQKATGHVRARGHGIRKSTRYNGRRVHALTSTTTDANELNKQRAPFCTDLNNSRYYIIPP
jgi:hypothetical protein